jgi:hypothetical protein
LENITSGKRLKANDIELAVKEYGKVLILPPEKAFHELDAIQLHDMKPSQWSVRMNLWTKEEGISDLSIILIIQSDNGFDVEIDDLHVL